MEELKKTTKEITPPKTQTIYQQLNVPIPKEYLFDYTEDGKTFTGYNAQYAINLLNDTLGYGAWWLNDELLDEQQVNGAFIVSMHTKLYITIGKEETHIIDGWGALYAKNPANAFKGAKTSAFKNACRFLGIGKELYVNKDDDDIDKSKTEVKETVIPTDVKTLEEQINKAETVDQLGTLESKVEEIEDKDIEKVITRQYNKRKIELIEKL